MSSFSKKRKQSAIEKKKKRPASSPKTKDGDRGRRTGPIVREAIARKREINGWTIDDGPPIDVTGFDHAD